MQLAFISLFLLATPLLNLLQVVATPILLQPREHNWTYRGFYRIQDTQEYKEACIVEGNPCFRLLSEKPKLQSECDEEKTTGFVLERAITDMKKDLSSPMKGRREEVHLAVLSNTGKERTRNEMYIKYEQWKPKEMGNMKGFCMTNRLGKDAKFVRHDKETGYDYYKYGFGDWPAKLNRELLLQSPWWWGWSDPLF
ncbi:hypothetical protein AMATHDRAFT_51441 [Amanita thiersii Skay4041]|uniref:Uncharacterized protein n=1 Tax=Amanita thiersii Skay4041 TaxID=703135 RepID=A0A2A9N780_9AGAR|nr:hypothetical protein AMATHDRAFT_51441 [Amanita thiersii Skay4041]